MIPNVTVLLLHSPMLAAAATWGDLPGRLGEPVLAPEVRTDGGPPYAARYVDDVVRQVLQARDATPTGGSHAAGSHVDGGAAGSGTDTAAGGAAGAGHGAAGSGGGAAGSDVDVAGSGGLAVLAHSGAGPLVPAVVAALAAAGLRVAEAVYLDAMLPVSCLDGFGGTGGVLTTRLDVLAAEDAAVAADLRALLAGGGRFPNWTAEQLAAVVPEPAVVVGGMRPRGLDYFTEPLPDAPPPAGLPCGYVQLSATYGPHADRAAALGWPVLRAELGHFGPLSDPAAVADLVRRIRASHPTR